MQRKTLSIPEHLNIRALFEKRGILSWYFFGAPYPLMRLHFPSLLQSPKSESRSKSPSYPQHDVLHIFLSRASVANSWQNFPASMAKKIGRRGKSTSNFYFYEDIWDKGKTILVYVFGKSIIFLGFSRTREDKKFGPFSALYVKNRLKFGR
jgi:hypothetical protein